MRFFLVLFIIIIRFDTSYSKEVSDDVVCSKIFYSNMHQIEKYIQIAKERNLSCGVRNDVSKN